MRKTTKILGSVRLTQEAWSHIEDMKVFFLEKFYIKASTSNIIEACIEACWKTKEQNKDLKIKEP